ncbi:DUF7527 domain-containing protein [Natronobeatus ordinarius]|uniref:DUF7527 domain-containing protein n=1 Tax=Natronobeatus ordinarius TaxID=2963433 RepID=UPI0020CCA323|nr:transcriptional regulator [Natronobeatus ordinarius]
MDSRTQERVERWDSRPFSGGTDGLSDLADRGFSGAIHANGAWLFVLNGRTVGVFGGDLEDVTDGAGTLYEAPDPALPLLAAMETRGGETRAKYYTNETPLEEVDETLTDGSFTGYVELSEKVLSGDYYLVYYGGRRMAAAYIGNAERLITDDEAFERAADEVGIYEVIDVDVDVTDLRELADPGPDVGDEPSTASTAAADVDSSAADSDDESAANSSPPTDPAPADDALDVDSGIEPLDVNSGIEPLDVDSSGDESASDSSEGSPAPSEAVADDDEPGITTADDRPDDPSAPGITDSLEAVGDADERAAAFEADDESVSATDAQPAADAADDPLDHVRESTEEPVVATESESDDSSAADASDGSPIESAESPVESAESADVAESTDADSDLEEQLKQEARWRETRRIPSIDPDNTSDRDAESRRRSSRRSSTEKRQSSSTTEASQSSARTRAASDATRTQASNAREADRSDARPAATDARRRSAAVDSRTQAGSESPGSGRSERVEQFTQRIETLENRCETLSAQRDELLEERDRLKSANQDQSATIERLQSRIDELEAELERARSSGGAGTGGGTQLSATQALEGTNLFVRYDSKSRATLASAHAGEADASEVDSNLRLEHHTEFEDADAVVDGEAYEAFLPATMEYQTVEWLINTLVYEIRDTGRGDDLGDLYDAIPRIDRAEFDAPISLAEDDTEDVPDEVRFDVVAYDKMGNPLVVLVLNDSREPASRELLEELEASASAVKANYPDLAAALVVTSSFFEPGALEVTEQATSAGFLRRGSKLSYVNLSRKQGYHLCLVEARSGGFHVTVPEL